jgi:hypothetical protein
VVLLRSTFGAALLEFAALLLEDELLAVVSAFLGAELLGIASLFLEVVVLELTFPVALLLLLAGVL